MQLNLPFQGSILIALVEWLALFGAGVFLF